MTDNHCESDGSQNPENNTPSKMTNQITKRRSASASAGLLSQGLAHHPEEKRSMLDPSGALTLPINEDLDNFYPPDQQTVTIDGGYGWVVVFASFMVSLIHDGIIFTIGVFFSRLTNEFNEGKGIVAWIPSILTSMVYFMGPLASGLCNVYGCRAVGILGSLIAALGLGLGSVSQNFLQLTFTFGILTGIGFGLAFLPQLMIVTYYFEKKRGIATGISICGTGFGTIIFGPMTAALIDYVGWRPTMAILSAISLSCIYFCWLFKPLYGIEPAFTDYAAVPQDPYEPEGKPLSSDYKGETKGSNGSINSKGKSQKVIGQLVLAIQETLDFSQLRDPVFIIFCLGAFSSSLGYYVPTTFMEEWAADEGTSHIMASFLYTYFGVANMLGQVAIGLIGDEMASKRLIFLIISTFAMAGVTSLSYFCRTYIAMVFFALAIGLAQGSYITMSSVAPVDLFGVQRASNAFGLTSFFDGFGSLLGPPIVGYLRDRTGKYDAGYQFAALSFASNAILIVIIPFLMKKSSTSSDSSQSKSNPPSPSLLSTPTSSSPSASPSSSEIMTTSSTATPSATSSSSSSPLSSKKTKNLTIVMDEDNDLKHDDNNEGADEKEGNNDIRSLCKKSSMCQSFGNVIMIDMSLPLMMNGTSGRMDIDIQQDKHHNAETNQIKCDDDETLIVNNNSLTNVNQTSLTTLRSSSTTSTTDNHHNSSSQLSIST